MSLFDNVKTNMKKTARELIGVQTVAADCLQTARGDLAYFKVSPSNIAVLSSAGIDMRIRQLMIVLSSYPELELCCFDSAESFDANKAYLKVRGFEEPSPAVRDLLRQDLKHLDEIQVTTATAREFMFVARFRKESDEQFVNSVTRLEKVIRNQGFSVNSLGKQDLKKMLMIYFEQNMTSVRLDDTDGDRYSEQLTVTEEENEEGDGNVA